MLKLIGLTEQGLKWIFNCLDCEDWQYMRNGALIDQHCVEYIVDGMDEDGLKNGIDYEVC